MQNETETRLIRQLSEVEVAKYKAVAENASKNALDYASLHGYESWMQALKSAHEEARLSRENEHEAIKQTGYVIEELKKMTMYKERAELETKQVMLRYGGLSMKQLIYPSEMNIDEAQNLLISPSQEPKQQNAAEDSSSFFSTFRRKLKEKFGSLSQKKEEDRTSNDDSIEPKTRFQTVDRMTGMAFARKSDVIDKQHARLPIALTKNVAVSATKSTEFLHPNSTQSPKHSPQKLSPSRANALGVPQLSKLHVSPMKSSPTSISGHEDSNFPSDHSSRTTDKAESRSSKGSSRPSSADSGSLQSAREVHEGRLPAQYQLFRTRQSNSTAISKLCIATPRHSDASGPRYHMRRDVSITDPTQCIWLQKASGPLTDRCI